MFKSTKKTTEKAAFQPLETAEMAKTKGGWLVTCEEKRGLLTGAKYEVWVMKWDGSLKMTYMV